MRIARVVVFGLGIWAGAVLASNGDAGTSSMPDGSSGVARGPESAADFGPTPVFYSPLDASSLSAFNDNTGFERGSNLGGLFCRPTATETRVTGQFQVPHGARIGSLRVWLFDNQATALTSATLQQSCLPDFAEASPTVTPLATVETTAAFSAGVFSDFANPPAGTIGDNQSCVFRLVATLGSASCPGGQFGLGIYKARLAWFRQIPPAPAVASFADVPTSDPSFQVIEALVDTGITVGCGGGNFCPAQLVTRAQMAAFLARALGLWPETIADPANP